MYMEESLARFSDDSLRPALSLADYADSVQNNPHTRLIAALGKVRRNTPALSYGDYKELLLTNRQYAFSRTHQNTSVIVTVNNDDSDYVMTLPASDATEYIGTLSGERVSAEGGRIVVNVRANAGDIWAPVSSDTQELVSKISVQTDVTEAPKEKAVEEKAQPDGKTSAEGKAQTHGGAFAEEKTQPAREETAVQEAAVGEESRVNDEAFEKGRIAGLQEAILAIMEKNGPVTDQMRRDVAANVYHDSLITWIKSFR